MISSGRGMVRSKSLCNLHSLKGEMQDDEQKVDARKMLDSMGVDFDSPLARSFRNVLRIFLASGSSTGKTDVVKDYRYTWSEAFLIKCSMPDTDSTSVTNKRNAHGLVYILASFKLAYKNSNKYKNDLPRMYKDIVVGALDEFESEVVVYLSASGYGFDMKRILGEVGANIEKQDQESIKIAVERNTFKIHTKKRNLIRFVCWILAEATTIGFAFLGFISLTSGLVGIGLSSTAIVIIAIASAGSTLVANSFLFYKVNMDALTPFLMYLNFLGRESYVKLGAFLCAFIVTGGATIGLHYAWMGILNVAPIFMSMVLQFGIINVPWLGIVNWPLIYVAGAILATFFLSMLFRIVYSLLLSIYRINFVEEDENWNWDKIFFAGISFQSAVGVIISTCYASLNAYLMVAISAASLGVLVWPISAALWLCYYSFSYDTISKLKFSDLKCEGGTSEKIKKYLPYIIAILISVSLSILGNAATYPSVNGGLGMYWSVIFFALSFVGQVGNILLYVQPVTQVLLGLFFWGKDICNLLVYAISFGNYGSTKSVTRFKNWYKYADPKTIAVALIVFAVLALNAGGFASLALVGGFTLSGIFLTAIGFVLSLSLNLRGLSKKSRLTTTDCNFAMREIESNKDAATLIEEKIATETLNNVAVEIMVL